MSKIILSDSIKLEDRQDSNNHSLKIWALSISRYLSYNEMKAIVKNHFKIFELQWDKSNSKISKHKIFKITVSNWIKFCE